MALWIRVGFCAGVSRIIHANRPEKFRGCQNLATAEARRPSMYLKLISMSPPGSSELFEGPEPFTAVLMSLGPDTVLES